MSQAEIVVITSEARSGFSFSFASGCGNRLLALHLVERLFARRTQHDVISESKDRGGRNPVSAERARGAEVEGARINVTGSEHCGSHKRTGIRCGSARYETQVAGPQ